MSTSNTSPEDIKKAEARGYSRGYAAGRRREGFPAEVPAFPKKDDGSAYARHRVLEIGAFLEASSQSKIVGLTVTEAEVLELYRDLKLMGTTTTSKEA